MLVGFTPDASSSDSNEYPPNEFSVKDLVDPLEGIGCAPPERSPGRKGRFHWNMLLTQKFGTLPDYTRLHYTPQGSVSCQL